MSNWEMLTSEFCGQQDLERYMNSLYRGGQVPTDTPYEQRPENSWDYWDLVEECDNNLEYVLDFLGISWRSWEEIEEELRQDEWWDSFNPNDDRLYVPADWEVLY